MTVYVDDMRARNGRIGAQLAAILKGISGPLPARQIRLAALLALEPSLLLPFLDEHDADRWRRLIGPDIDLPPSPAFVAGADPAWGDAVRYLRAGGHLVEDIQAGTWAPGPGLDRFVTDGWPDDRARMVLGVLATLCDGIGERL